MPWTQTFGIGLLAASICLIPLTNSSDPWKDESRHHHKHHKHHHKHGHNYRYAEPPVGVKRPSVVERQVVVERPDVITTSPRIGVELEF
jgi:hypothetical protein